MASVKPAVIRIAGIAGSLRKGSYNRGLIRSGTLSLFLSNHLRQFLFYAMSLLFDTFFFYFSFWSGWDLQFDQGYWVCRCRYHGSAITQHWPRGGWQVPGSSRGISSEDCLSWCFPLCLSWVQLLHCRFVYTEFRSLFVSERYFTQAFCQTVGVRK